MVLVSALEIRRHGRSWRTIRGILHFPHVVRVNLSLVLPWLTLLTHALQPDFFLLVIRISFSDCCRLSQSLKIMHLAKHCQRFATQGHSTTSLVVDVGGCLEDAKLVGSCP